ncbi:MAG: ribonuclease P, partial [Crenarchaeota archaeon]|nr:ribonuclease P [Thermoproteota archaeon]
MKITPDIIRYEFIGTKGLVSASSNSNLIGINGFVVGETRNTFILQDEGSTWNVLKEASTFNFTFNDGTV